MQLIDLLDLTLEKLLLVKEIVTVPLIFSSLMTWMHMLGVEPFLRPWGKDKENHKEVHPDIFRPPKLKLAKHWPTAAPRPNLRLYASGALPEQRALWAVGPSQGDIFCPYFPVCSQYLAPRPAGSYLHGISTAYGPAGHHQHVGDSTVGNQWGTSGGLCLGVGDHTSPLASGPLTKLICQVWQGGRMCWTLSVSGAENETDCGGCHPHYPPGQAPPPWAGKLFLSRITAAESNWSIAYPPSTWPTPSKWGRSFHFC